MVCSIKQLAVGISRDYPYQVRRLRKFHAIQKLFTTTGGQFLDEVAMSYKYGSCDALLDDLETAVENRRQLRETFPAKKTRRHKKALMKPMNQK